MELPDLPKLLYIGDVAVESTVAGSALIYRLLEKYPTDKLSIVEGSTHISKLETRLQQVNYQTLNIGNQRIINSRLNKIYSSYLFLTARQKVAQLKATVEKFKPEAILTVAHGFSWLTAAELAKYYRLPLHLIVHDDLPSYMPGIDRLKTKVEQQFAQVYRQAKSRFCVSPYMEQHYQVKYGMSGSILYPSRAADVQEFDTPPNRVNNESLTFAYAGSINTPGQAKTLVDLASVINKFNSKLIIYSALERQSIDRLSLNQTNIEVRSLIPYEQLINNLRKEADVLFAPMDFDVTNKSNMQLCFPSKLTDYTAIGLPVLIWGAEYCSAVKWAKDNPGVAEVVDTEDLDALFIAVEKLCSSSDYRYVLGLNALQKGKEYFNCNNVVRHFYQSITLNYIQRGVVIS